MNLPADKYVLQDYRDDLRVVEAPQFIDSQTGIIPVKNIGNGIPKPNSRQRLRYITVRCGVGLNRLQLITPTSSQKIYLLGFVADQTGTTAQYIVLYDALSGNAPAAAADTAYSDELGYLARIDMTATAYEKFAFTLPFPVLLKNGLRVEYGAAAAANVFLTIYYIEEVA